MSRQSNVQIRQQDAYEQGRIDADNSTAASILLEQIERAQAFRLHRGRQLRASALVRLGLDDLISVN